jgi:archaemetzincin
MIQRLEPLHEHPARPRPGEWLAEHGEPGQSFAEYLDDHPVMPDPEHGPGKRRILYVQPLGVLTATQHRMVELAGEYMHAFFGLDVRMKPPLSLELLPASARRIHPSWGTKQILTSSVLDDVLAPRLPDDAAAYISFTASDLWPGKGWNFVFGQASLRDRVGVWSIYRNGDPDESDQAFRLALLRTLKVAVHESGHMFSLHHCTAHACVMAGSNSLDESDRHPLWLCPQCLAKIAWATHADVAARYRRLHAIAERNGLRREADFFLRSLDALAQPSP